MEKFFYHLKNYFDISTALPPLFFAIIYVLLTFTVTPLLLTFINPEQIEGLMTGEITRLSLMPRLAFAGYELLLIPLYIKRLLDMNWQGIQRDMVVIAILLPVVLTTLLSEGGYAIVLPFIGFLRLLALVLTFMLFIFPTRKSAE